MPKHVSEDISSLAYYVLDIYREFVDNRKDLKNKWQRNLDAYRRMNNGVWKTGEGEEWRSDVFDAVTKQKILAAVAICIDSYIQGGKVPFDLKASTYELQAAGVPSYEELPEDMQGQIDERIKTMRKNIEEQFDLCRADRQLIQHFLAAAVYGITYAKCSIQPFSNEYYQPITDTMSPSQEFARYEKVQTEVDSPNWEYVTTWDIFTDYEETDLTKCHAVIHRQMLSPFQVREQIEDAAGVFDDQLSAALREQNQSDDDDTSELPPALRDVPNRKQNLRYLEYWGRIPRSTLEDFANDTSGGSPRQMWTLSESEDDEDEGDMVECLVGVLGETVVRVAVTEDAKQRPFFCAKWEDNFDGQGGIGIADNTEDVQMMRNGLLRLFYDNKALSANVSFGQKREMLRTKLDKFVPGMTIDVSEECQDVRQAIQQIVIQDVGESLLNALSVTDQWLDDDSMIPKIQQGHSSQGDETKFELSQRLEKSGKYLALVMRNFDDGLTEPISKWFYDYNMEDPEADGKGSFDVIATGFTSFQNRIERLTTIRELLNIAVAMNNGGTNIKLMEIFREIAEMGDVDPDQFIVSEEEAAQSEPDPMQEAEIAKTQSETAKNQAQAKEAEAKAQAETAKVRIEAEKVKIEQIKALKENEQDDASSIKGPDH